MIPKTIVLLLAILVACSYAAAPMPISTNKKSTIQSGMDDPTFDLDEDESLGPYTLPLAAERYLKEENIKFEPDEMLDDEDGASEGMEGTIAERDIIDKAKKLCYKIKKNACKIKKLCCCKFSKKKRKKCKRKCKKKAKKKCGI